MEITFDYQKVSWNKITREVNLVFTRVLSILGNNFAIIHKFFHSCFPFPCQVNQIILRRLLFDLPLLLFLCWTFQISPHSCGWAPWNIDDVNNHGKCVWPTWHIQWSNDAVHVTFKKKKKRHNFPFFLYDV
jgi:hypothetical protein